MGLVGVAAGFCGWQKLVEADTSEQTNHRQQQPDDCGGAAARIPQHKTDEQVAKERHAASRTGIEAVVAAELLGRGVAWQLGGKEREAENGSER